MRKVLFLFLTFIFASIAVSKAQSYKVDLQIEALKNYESIKEGQIIQIDSVKKKFVYNELQGWISTGYQLVTNDGRYIDITKSIGDKLKFKCNTIQDIWDTKIITNVLYELNK